MEVDDLGRYLAVPMLHRRVSKSSYSYLVQKVHDRLLSILLQCRTSCGLNSSVLSISVLSVCMKNILKPNCSHLWRGISDVWNDVRKGILWNLGNGEGIDFLRDNWVSEIHPLNVVRIRDPLPLSCFTPVALWLQIMGIGIRTLSVIIFQTMYLRILRLLSHQAPHNIIKVLNFRVVYRSWTFGFDSGIPRVTISGWFYDWTGSRGLHLLVSEPSYAIIGMVSEVSWL
ncbi:hypothetical protein GQ457_03G015360 [Hibiscus cannabinus]